MQQHAVPQNVTNFEFKIVGILTLKQFAMLAVCVVMAFISYLIVPNFIIKILFIVFFVALGLLLTFGSIQQIPFYRWIFIFAKAIFSPTQRIWIKSAKVPAYMTQVSAIVVVPEKRIIEDRSVLTSYLQTLPTHTNNSIDILEQQRLQSIGMAQGQNAQVFNMPSSSSNTPNNFQKPNPTPSSIPKAPTIPTPPNTQNNDKLKPKEALPPKVASERTFNLPSIPVTSSQITNHSTSQKTPEPAQAATISREPQTSPSPIQKQQIPATDTKPLPIPVATVPQIIPQTPQTTIPKPSVATIVPQFSPIQKVQLTPIFESHPAFAQKLDLNSQQLQTPSVATAPKIEPQVQKPIPQDPSSELSKTTPLQTTQTQTPLPQPTKAQAIAISTPYTLTPTQTPTNPQTNSSPKFWSTIQKIEREYIKEMYEFKDQEELSLAEKQSEIQKLQEQLAKQKVDLAQKEVEQKNKEESTLNDIKSKLEAEKTRRETFEKSNSDLNQKLVQTQTEKTSTEEKLKLQLSSNTSEDQKLKSQVQDLNGQLITINKEIEDRITQEKQRQQKETEQIKFEYEAQKKLLENQKLEIEKQKAQIELEYKSVIKNNQTELEELKKKNEQLLKEKKTLEDSNAKLTQEKELLHIPIPTAQTQPAQPQDKKLQSQLIRMGSPANIPMPPKSNKSASEDLDKIATDLQKQTAALGIVPENQASIRSETLIKPQQQAPKALAPKPKLAPEKPNQSQLITELGVANIPPITTLINVINGVVYDAAGNFVPNVIIIVKDTEKTPVRALKSNRLGQFAISTPLPNGIYTMEFEDSKEEKTFDIYQITLSGNVIPPIAVKEKN